MTTTLDRPVTSAAAPPPAPLRDAARLILRIVAGLLAVDLSVAARGVVEAVLADVAQVRRWLDGVELRAVGRLAQLAEATPSIFPEQIVAAATRSDLRHGARVVERAATATPFKAVAQGVGDGVVSGAHLDVLTGALAGLERRLRPALTEGDGRLAEIAARTTPAGFRQAVQDDVRRIEADDGVSRLARQKRLVGLRSWLDKASGMIRVSGQFDPETGLTLIARLENTVETLFHGATPEHCPSDPGLRNDFLRAHALLALIGRHPASVASACSAAREGAGSTPAPETHASADGSRSRQAAGGCPTGPAPARTGHRSGDADMAVMGGRAEVLVLVDYETLTLGRHPTSRVETDVSGLHLPVETIRRMTCLADIVPVLLDGRGVVLKLGRTVRLANRAQRRALRAMYDSCAIDGCEVAYRHCQPHHITWFRRDGTTDLDNLLPLCGRHHHAVHEGGWVLSLAPSTRRLTVTLPDGTALSDREPEPP